MRPTVLTTFFAVLTAAAALAALGAADSPSNPDKGDDAPGRAGRDVTHQLTVGDLDRSFVVHLPPQYDGEKALPVVLTYHGGGGNAQQFKQWCGLDDKADEAGFIVVYPNGTGRIARLLTFNAGICCGYAQNNNIDDVGFTRALLDDLEQRYKVDKRRIFATGMSNGAMISYRVAIELSDRIAAIAPVGATMGVTEPRPARPVPVVHFHGTNDQHAAYNGGPGEHSVSRTDFMPVKDCITWWVESNYCDKTPVKDTLPDVADDGTRVHREVYAPVDKAKGAEVVLYTIENGGHTWPGRPPASERAAAAWRNSRLIQSLGPSTKDISANDVMWEFFQKHPMPE